MRAEVKELSSAAPAVDAARALFFVEYGMGHKTHLRFLEEHLDRDPRFDASVIRLYWMDGLLEWLGRFHLLPLWDGGLDFWTWWIFQFKRQQVRYLLRRYDPNEPNHHLYSWNVQTLANLVASQDLTISQVQLGEFGYDRFAAKFATRFHLGEKTFRFVRALVHLIRPGREVQLVARKSPRGTEA